MTRPSERLARLGSTVAVALALAMLGSRLWGLGLAPFVLDEPTFLTAAGEQLRTGRWALSAPMMGTMGFRYGPTATWYYGVVQAVAGPDPRAAILTTCGVVTLSHLLLAWALARAFGGGRLLFAGVLAFIAASPYQFFWARTAWDPLTNAVASFSVALVSSRERFGPSRAVALGLLLGLGLSSHPMIGPFVAAVAVLLLSDLWRTPKRLFGLGALTSGAMLLVNVPYLLYLRTTPVSPPVSRGFFLSTLGEFLREPGRVATSWGLEYFFDNEWGVFLAWLGPWRALLQPSLTPVYLLLAVAVAGLLLGTLAGGAERRLALFAAGSWLFYALFYASRDLDRHPHYQLPVCWVVPVGVAGVLAWARRRGAALGGAAAVAVFGFAALQFAFISAWMGYVKENGGIRGIHYSTPVALQQQAVRAACAQPEQNLILQNSTLIFPESLKYLVSAEPACVGKRVLICPYGGCPPPPPGGRGLTLVYARNVGGAVEWR